MNQHSDFTAWLSDHLLTCPIKACTGVDCPGCGMQRSVIQLLDGDVAGSIEMHPAGIPMLFLILFLILHLIFDFKHGAKILTYTFMLSTALTLINYIYKIYSGTLIE